jgi:hypothetical protein
MDPTTLILTALAQGTAKAATDVVPDAYKALRELLNKRFAGKPAAEMVLHEHAADPVTYEAPMRKQLELAVLSKDPEVLALARQLLEQVATTTTTTTATPVIEIGRGARGIIGQNISGATIVGDIH